MGIPPSAVRLGAGLRIHPPAGWMEHKLTAAMSLPAGRGTQQVRDWGLMTKRDRAMRCIRVDGVEDGSGACVIGVPSRMPQF